MKKMFKSLDKNVQILQLAAKVQSFYLLCKPLTNGIDYFCILVIPICQRTRVIVENEHIVFTSTIFILSL